MFANDEDQFNEVLVEAYFGLLKKWLKEFMLLEKHNEIIKLSLTTNSNLLSVISYLKIHVLKLDYELYFVTKYVCMLNLGTAIVDEIINIGKSLDNHKGLGYIGES